MLPHMSQSAPKKRRRRELDPLDTPEINAFVDSLLKQATSTDDITGHGGILQQLQARLVERALEAEMSSHLGHELGERPDEAQPNLSLTPGSGRIAYARAYTENHYGQRKKTVFQGIQGAGYPAGDRWRAQLQ